jgi:hypothetical protein
MRAISAPTKRPGDAGPTFASAESKIDVGQYLKAWRCIVVAAMFDGFEASTVDADETTIFIRRKGNGRPLLLLHGFPETHAMWRAVAPTLGDAFTAICADLRGYGASGKPPSTPDHTRRVQWRGTWCK